MQLEMQAEYPLQLYQPTSYVRQLHSNSHFQHGVSDVVCNSQ